MPSEIENGISFIKNTDKFPDEYCQLFEGTNDDAIPVVEALKRSKSNNTGKNRDQKKVIPILEYQEKAAILSAQQRNDQPLATFSNTASANINMTHANFSTHEDRDKSVAKTRNRHQFQYSSVIHEHEEEGKGTIDYRNRNGLRNDTTNRHFHTHRDEINHNRNESRDPLMLEDQDDQVHSNYSVKRSNQRVEESKLDEHEQDEEMKSNHLEEGRQNFSRVDLDDSAIRSIQMMEERKRSISAQEPVRKLPRFEEPNSLPQMMLKKNNLILDKKFIQKEEKFEEIEELIGNVIGPSQLRDVEITQQHKS